MHDDGVARAVLLAGEGERRVEDVADAGAAGGVDGGEVDGDAVGVVVRGVGDEEEGVDVVEGGFEVGGGRLVAGLDGVDAGRGVRGGDFGAVAGDEGDVCVWDEG